MYLIRKKLDFYFEQLEIIHPLIGWYQRYTNLFYLLFGFGKIFLDFPDVYSYLAY